MWHDILSLDADVSVSRLPYAAKADLKRLSNQTPSDQFTMPRRLRSVQKPRQIKYLICKKQCFMGGTGHTAGIFVHAENSPQMGKQQHRVIHGAQKNLPSSNLNDTHAVSSLEALDGIA